MCVDLLGGQSIYLKNARPSIGGGPSLMLRNLGQTRSPFFLLENGPKFPPLVVDTHIGTSIYFVDVCLSSAWRGHAQREKNVSEGNTFPFPSLLCRPGK